MALDAGLLYFTVPAMGGAAVTNNQVSLASAADVGFINITQPCEVAALGFMATVNSTTTAVAVTFTQRPTPNSASGEATIGVVTAPSATLNAGTTVRKNIGRYALNQGDQVRVSVSTAGTGGSGTCFLIAYPTGNPLLGSEEVASTT